MTLAIVTGANRGLGFEVVRQLAQQSGTTVILTARSMEKAQAAADQLTAEGLDVVPKVADVTDDTSVQQLAADVESEYGVLDILVNNAAAYVDPSEFVENADMGPIHNVMETNLFGPWRMSKAFLPLLRKSDHPRIVNVSSEAGTHADTKFGLPKTQYSGSSYGVTKAALNAFTVKLAAELADTPIMVNAVSPGLTATVPGMEAYGARPVPEGAKSIVDAVNLPKDGPRGQFFRDGDVLPW